MSETPFDYAEYEEKVRGIIEEQTRRERASREGKNKPGEVNAWTVDQPVRAERTRHVDSGRVLGEGSGSKKLSRSPENVTGSREESKRRRRDELPYWTPET